MNKLILRQREVQDSYFDCDDLFEVVSRIKKQMEEKQQIVCSIRLNDKEIAEEQERDLVSFKLASVRMLEVEFCDYEVFYNDFLNSTIKFVSDLKAICPHLSEAIYDQQMERFHRIFQDYIESMESLMEAIHFIHHKRKDVVNEKDWRTIENRTSEVLKQVLELYSAKDLVSLADVFDYEMVDVLEDWTGLLQTVRADGTANTRTTKDN